MSIFLEATNSSQIEEFFCSGMLCVWDKKKLTLEQRQQLGGGGAQSIKVCYLFVFPFLRCLFVFLVLQCNDGGAKSKVNHTEEISRRC